MTSKDKAPESVLKPPKVKDHAVLRSLEAQLRGTQITDTFELGGHKYTLRTLWPFEESWADGFVGGSNFYQQGRSRRAPYVAASLEAIDGTPVRELFQPPDDTPDTTKELYAQEPELLAEWRRRAVLAWLAGPDRVLPPQVLNELWLRYQGLEERQREALEAIGPLSPRTEGQSGGVSLLTSLLGNKS